MTEDPLTAILDQLAAHREQVSALDAREVPVFAGIECADLLAVGGELVEYRGEGIFGHGRSAPGKESSWSHAGAGRSSGKPGSRPAVMSAGIGNLAVAGAMGCPCRRARR